MSSRGVKCKKKLDKNNMCNKKHAIRKKLMETKKKVQNIQ